MKKLILILLLLLFQIPVFSEEFPPSGAGIEVTKETNPIYWGYFEDYSKALKQALEAEKMFRLRGWGSNCEYIVTRNGEIKGIKTNIYQNDYFDEKVKNIILSVKPLPFRDGMNMDEMRFSVYLGYERYNEIRISVGSSFIDNKKTFSLMIITNK